MQNFATLALAGRPWGDTSAFAMWGGMALQHLGLPVQTGSGSDPAMQKALSGGVLACWTCRSRATPLRVESDTMGLKLYTWTTPNGRKISIMLEELGLAYQVRPIDINRGAQFAPEFLRLSPNNKIPALVDEDAEGGTLAVFESGAILSYLAEKTGRLLAPSGPPRYAAMEWLHWTIGGLGPMIGQLNYFALQSADRAPLAIGRFSQEADRLLGVMDRRLRDSVYLGGDDYSIADVAAYPWTFFASTSLDHVLADSLASKRGVYRWLALVGARPAVRRGMRVPPVEDLPPREQIESLKRRIALAEEERDALRSLSQEEDYLQACSLVEALELQLEERLRQAVT